MTWVLSLILAGAVFSGSPTALVSDFEPGISKIASGVGVKEESEITEQVFPINPDGRIEVSNINGSIDIEAWDRSEVKLVSKKIARTRDRFDDIEVKVSSSASHLKVEVVYKRWKGKWIKGDDLYVEFRLMVPRTAALDEIESVNGGVKVTGTSNLTKVAVVNGSIRAFDLGGNVDISTVNGSLVAEFKVVSPSSVISLSTVNGSAEVRLPSNVSATVKADTVNGSIKNSYGLPVRKGEYVGRDLYGRIGSGASKVRLNSVNGSLNIFRVDDGLPLSESKDLLPSKTSDDFEDSFDEGIGEFEVDGGRIAEQAAIEAREMENQAMQNVGIIAAETAKINAEALRNAIGSIEGVNVVDKEFVREAARIALNSAELAKIDEARLEAELARIQPNVFGNRNAPYIEEDTKTVQVKGIPNVEIETKGANISVKSWDRQEFKYTVTRIARGRLSPVKNISFSQDKSNLSLKVKLVPGRLSDDILEQVQVEIYAPGNSNFEIDTDREIRVQGIVGKLSLVGETGSIDVRDSGGSLGITTTTGMIRVIGFDGDVDAGGKTGDMYLEGNFERISSRFESGNVFLAVGEDAGATIRTSRLGPDGKMYNDGNKLNADGLKIEKNRDDTWKLGDGKANYEFVFTTGRVQLRRFDSIAKG